MDTETELQGQAAALIKRAQLIFDDCRYERAIVFLEDAVSIHEHLYGKTHKETVNVMYQLARAHQELGNYTKAGEIFASCQKRTSLALADHTPAGISGKYNAGQAAVAHVLLSVADNCYYESQYEKAQEKYRDLLEIKNKLYGVKDHKSTGEIKARMALNTIALGKLNEADAMSYNAYMTVVKNWRTDSPELATAMFCRGLVLNSTGDVVASLSMLREAHKSRWKLLGRDEEKKSHPMLSECLLHIGINYLLQGRVNRAVAKIAEAHDMRLEYFRENHFSVLEAKYNHGMALLASGIYCHALDIHIFVLRERLGVPLSSYAPILTVPIRDDVCDSLVAVGMCYLYLGQLHAADRMVSEALRVLLNLFGGKNNKKNIGTSMHPNEHTQST